MGDGSEDSLLNPGLLPPWVPGPDASLTSEPVVEFSREWLHEAESTRSVNEAPGMPPGMPQPFPGAHPGQGADPGRASWAGMAGPFLREGERVRFAGLTLKRRGLFSVRRRVLVLTDAPRLLYLDPEKRELKGEVPWTEEEPVRRGGVVVERERGESWEGGGRERNRKPKVAE